MGVPRRNAAQERKKATGIIKIITDRLRELIPRLEGPLNLGPVVLRSDVGQGRTRIFRADRLEGKVGNGSGEWELQEIT